MNESFELSDGDRVSSLWKRIEQHLQGRLANLREGNDKPVDEATTAYNRGRIAMVKEVIALGHEALPLRKFS